jgi:hypothetical protein
MSDEPAVRTPPEAAVRMPVFNPPEGAPKVTTAIVGVMRDIESIPKSGKNLEQKYAYVEATVLTAKVQDAMVKNKLSLIPREVGRAVMGEGSILFMKFEFDAHCEDQSIMNIGSYSAACRFKFRNGSYDDKASAKCLTSAMKCMEIALFKIPADVDDIERDREDFVPPPDTSAGSTAPTGDAEPAMNLDVRTFRHALNSASIREQAEQIWLAHLALIESASDPVYRLLVDDYHARWNVAPPERK